MAIAHPTFSILITTKNRRNDLAFTLEKINHLLKRENVECMVCDDGSTDDTFSFVKNNYPGIRLYKNQVSRGYLYSRNFMLSQVASLYAISLDDDAHFVCENPIETIEKHFFQNPKCGLIAFRIFWNTTGPMKTETIQKTERVKGFVGCGHVWRMDAWRDVGQYPEWFNFYGEEDYAAFQLFIKQWEVHYLPEVLVHHRVSLVGRKKNKDYVFRLRNSLSSGWYLYFLFLPWICIPNKMVYSVWTQFKLKVFRGDFKALLAIILAMGDLIKNFQRLMINRCPMTTLQLKKFNELKPTQIYWKQD